MAKKKLLKSREIENRSYIKHQSLSSLMLIYSIGNLGTKGLVFVLFFLMTHYLTVVEMGQYDLIITTVTLVVPFVSLSLEFSLFRWLIDYKTIQEKSELISNILKVLLLSTLIYSVIFWLVIPKFEISSDLHIPVFFYSLCMICYPFMQQGTRGVGRQKLYTVSSIIYSVLYIIFTIIALSLGYKVKGVIYANILALSIIIIFLFLYHGWYKCIFVASVNFKKLRKYIGYSLPLIPNTISWWLISSFVRYVILLYLGKEVNGIFSVSYKYPSIILVFSDVFLMAWQEKMIRLKDDSIAQIFFHEIQKKYIRVLFSIVIFLTALSKYFVKLLNTGYTDIWKYIPILFFAVLLQGLASFYGAIYLRAKKSKIIFLSTLGGGITTVCLSFSLIKFELYGICFSILAGYLVIFLIRLFNARSFFATKFPSVLFIYLTSVFLIVSSLLYIESIIVAVFLIVFSVIFLFTLNFDIIKDLVSNILGKMNTKIR